MTKKKDTAITIPNTGETAVVPFDYGDDAGTGMDIGMDDLKIPFIALAQSDSKILDEEEEVYAPGGEPGKLFNGATREYYDDLILVLAVRRTTYVEWAPDRGGFVDEHSVDSPIVAQAKANAVKKHELFTEGGNELQETRSIFAIICDRDMQPQGYCVVPFTSSKMAPWREYWTVIDTARVSKSAPLFAHTVRLSSKSDKNKKGDKFKNFVMLPARDADGQLTTEREQANVVGSMLPPDHPAFLAAKALYEAVEAGTATADRDTAEPRDVAAEPTDSVF